LLTLRVSRSKKEVAMATAKDVMTSPVLGVRPDMTVGELAAFLARNQITGAPVLDAQQRVVGVVSNSDLAQTDRAKTRAHDSYVDGETLVEDIMTPGVFMVKEDAPLAILARTMVHGRVHRLFVAQGRHVVGVVSSLDLLKVLCEDGSGTGAEASGARAGASDQTGLSGL
jgi:predicted transcriptional regulator